MNGDIMGPNPRYSPGVPAGDAGPAPSPAPKSMPMATPPKRRGGFLRKLLWLVLIAAIVGGVYYWQNQKVSDLNKKLADANSQISRLNSQNYNLEQQVSSLNSAKNSQQFLKVKEWGVNVPLTSSTADLSYTLSTFNGKQNAQAAFRTKQLDTLFPSCTTDSVIIVRGQATDTFSGTGATAKTFKQQYDAMLADKNADWTKNVKPQLVNNYYYIQGQSGAACASKPADTTQENQILQAIKDGLQKITAAS